jgi:hypothetical protein
MNLSLGHFLHGIFGAFLGACLSLGYYVTCYHEDIFYRHINIMTIIIVSAIFFFVFFYGETIS